MSYKKNVSVLQNNVLSLSGSSVTVTGSLHGNYMSGTVSEFTIVTASNLVAGGVKYPTADGASGQILVTDGTGELNFQDVDVTIRVKNLEASTIIKGTPLYVTASGTGGNIVGVYRADAGDDTRMPAACVAGEDLTSGAEGLAYLSGFINKVNTSTFNSGDEVYVAVGGGYTNIRPTGSAKVQPLGYVEKSSLSGSGVIQGPGHFWELPNVTAGHFWVGASNGVPTTVASSSFAKVAEENSFTANNIFTTITASHIDVDTITAREYYTEVVTASVIFQSGSTKFGNTSDDKHQFTGSIRVNGTAQILGDTEITGLIKHGNNNIDLFENMVFKAGYAQSNFEFRDIYNSGLLYISQSGDVGIGTNSPNAKLDVNGNAVVSGSLTVTDAVTATGFTGPLNGNADTATSATSALTASSVQMELDYTATSAKYLTFLDAYNPSPGTGQKIKTGYLLYYIPSTNTLYSNFNGSLTGNASSATTATTANSALTASSVQMELDYTSTSAKYLTFLDAYNPSTGTGQKVKTGYSLYYIPSTNTLYSNFSGSLTGNASSATYATNVSITEQTSNGSYYIPFMGSYTTTSSRTLYGDSGIYYNPSSNTLTVGTLVETSTRDIKENIKSIPNQLSKIKKLNPVKYNKINSERNEIGLIAEEVQKVYPEFVYEKGINYPKMVSVLISAVQELTEKVEYQQKQIEQIKKKAKNINQKEDNKDTIVLGS